MNPNKGILSARCMVELVELHNYIAGLLKMRDGIFFPPEGPIGSALFNGGDYTFVYDYPLNTPAEFVHTLTVETTALDLLKLGEADYRRIYDEEAASAPVPAENSMQIGAVTLMNRTRTTGKYGIWGHVLGDLYFEGIEIDTVKRIVTFSMGS